MKKGVLLSWILFFSVESYAQEDPAIIQMLRKKYDYVSFQEGLADDMRKSYYYIGKGGKYGACDLKGKEIVPPLYDFAAKEDDYYICMINDYSDQNNKKSKYGIYDLAGKEIISPDKYNYISKLSTTGNFIGRQYYEAIVYGSNPIDHYEDSKWALYDLKGKLILPCEYDRIGWHDDIWAYGCLDVQKSGKWGISDFKGKKILPCVYTNLYTKKGSNLIIVTKGGQNSYTLSIGSKWGIVDTTGKTLVDCKYDYIRKPYDGMFPCNKGCRVEGIDRSSEIIKGGSWGFIDSIGNVVVPLEYAYVSNPSEGLILCNKGGDLVKVGYKVESVEGGKWGFVDYKGNVIVPFEYDYASDFKDGISQAMKDGIASIITNPLKGTNLKVLNGEDNLIKVDVDIPITQKQNEETFAFIIGIENYSNFSGANYAINDGKIFKEYCLKTLGIPEKNIRYYEDATFGNMVSAIQKMKDIADVYEGDAKILFYFSGLGATDETTKEAYILPTDASLSSLSSTGYSMSKLLKILNELKTQITLVIMDAPFSGIDKTGKNLAKHRGVAISHKSYIPQGNMVVCMSCNNNENALSDKKYGHGLFTYALLDKLQQSKGDCNLKDLMEYAITWTKKKSLSEHDKIQTPQIILSNEIINKWPNIKF